jgi:predicted phosphoadenosine phosphosulfate sulfurtransferase
MKFSCAGVVFVLFLKRRHKNVGLILIGCKNCELLNRFVVIHSVQKADICHATKLEIMVYLIRSHLVLILK